jgi:hypothetical protein
MGCNCKETAKKAGKHSDDGSALELVTGLEKIFVFLGRIFLSILVLGVIIVILPVFLLYIVITTIIGREKRINLRRIVKFNEKRK